MLAVLKSQWWVVNLRVAQGRLHTQKESSNRASQIKGSAFRYFQSWPQPYTIFLHHIWVYGVYTVAQQGHVKMHSICLLYNTGQIYAYIRCNYTDIIRCTYSTGQIYAYIRCNYTDIIRCTYNTGSIYAYIRCHYTDIIRCTLSIQSWPALFIFCHFSHFVSLSLQSLQSLCHFSHFVTSVISHFSHFFTSVTLSLCHFSHFVSLSLQSLQSLQPLCHFVTSATLSLQPLCHFVTLSLQSLQSLQSLCHISNMFVSLQLCLTFLALWVNAHLLYSHGQP